MCIRDRVYTDILAATDHAVAQTRKANEFKSGAYFGSALLRQAALQNRTGCTSLLETYVEWMQSTSHYMDA